MKLGRGEHKLVKKQSLRWKNRMLLFQSPSWKSEKNERSKARFDECQARRGENKLDILPRISKEKKKNFDVCQAECRKGNADDYHTIEKAKSKRTEEMELA